MVSKQRFPRAISASVSKSMRSNRPYGTKPELLLSKLLRKKIRVNQLPGKPDFVYTGSKMAVFVHGCFWHRCPTCAFDLPKSNRSFWKKKFEQNVRRDNKVKRQLESLGWSVVEVWEHELRKNPREAKEKVMKHLNRNIRNELSSQQ